MSAFTCPHCSGPIVYDPSAGTMTCSYCDSVFSVDEYREQLDKSHKLLLNELSSPQCGGQLLTTDVTSATFCSYCGSSVALEGRLVEEDAPDTIIPFRVSAKEAQDIYADKVNRALLAPDWMKDDETISHFRGIYMPFHVFSYAWKGTWKGEADAHSVKRIGGAEYDVTTTYYTEADVDVNYSHIPQDASTAFPDSMSRAVCPYKEESQIPFDRSYYAGFYADRGDVDASLYEQTYADEVAADIDARGNVSVGHAAVSAARLTEDMELESGVKRAMFPVWFLSSRQKDKVNYACVNGETGELVTDIPIDFKKYLKASVILAGILSIFLNLFVTLKPDNMLVVTAVLALIVFIIAFNLLNDTYRREQRMDDPGYTGQNAKKVTEKDAESNADETTVTTVRKTIGVVVGCLVGAIVVMFLLYWIFEDAMIANMVLYAVLIALPIYIIVTIISTARRKARTKVKRQSAPFGYKLRVLVKPIIALVAAAVVFIMFSEVDEACYAAAMGSIAMIIWTAFDVVFAHNRFTMRDLPLFNEKRGGEE